MTGAAGAASPRGNPPAASGASVLLSKEKLIFARRFQKDKAGDHVNEVRFGSPVTLTRIVMSAPGPPTPAAGESRQQQHPPPLLRVFARDLLHPTSCRFAALCPNNLSVGAGQSSSFATEAVVTDHVILRGRYTAVDVQLYGRPEYDPAAVVDAAISGANASGHPLHPDDEKHLRQKQAALLPQRPTAAAAAGGQAGQKGPGAGAASGATGPAGGVKRPRGVLAAHMSMPLKAPHSSEDEEEQGRDAGGGEVVVGGGAVGGGVRDGLMPAPQLTPPGSSLLPLETVPAPLLAALRAAAEYYGEVGRSHGRIALNGPGPRLVPVMAAAKHVCRALAGHTQDLEVALATCAAHNVSPVAPGELESLCDMACEWCLLLASGRASRLEELNVGLAGMAAAVLLAVCTPSAPLLLAMGGAGQVVRALCLPNPPADLVRLAVACFDAMTLTCPAPAAEVLLARYRPPLPPPPVKAEDATTGGEGAAARQAVAAGQAGPGDVAVKTETVKVKLEDGGPPPAAGTAATGAGHPTAGAAASPGEERGTAPVVKAEGGDGGGAGATTYGDGQAHEGDDDDDCAGDAQEEDLDGEGDANRMPPTEAAAAGYDHDCGKVADDGDERAGDEEGGGGVRRGSSGAQAGNGVAAAEETAALIDDDPGLYEVFYDDFDDYYGGGEEEYEAAAAAGAGDDAGMDADGGEGDMPAGGSGDGDTIMAGQGGEDDGDAGRGMANGGAAKRGDEEASSHSDGSSSSESSSSSSGPSGASRRSGDEVMQDTAATAGDGAAVAYDATGGTALSASVQESAGGADVNDGDPEDNRKRVHSAAKSEHRSRSEKHRGHHSGRERKRERAREREGPQESDRERDRERNRERHRDSSRGHERRSRRRGSGASSRRKHSRSRSRSRSRSKARSRSRSRSNTRSKSSRGARSPSRSRSKGVKPETGRARSVGVAATTAAVTTSASQPARFEPPAVSAATPLLTVMLRRPRAPATAAAVARVMRRLTVADLVGKCAMACSSLSTSAPASETAANGVAAATAAAMEAMLPLRQLAAALPDLSEATAAGPAGAGSGGRIPFLGGARSAMLYQGTGGDSRTLVPEPPMLDPPVLQILASRQLFLLLAAALNAVHAHAGALRQALEAAARGSNSSDPASAATAQQGALYAQSHLQAAHLALLVGLRLLLAPLLSSPAGLTLVTAAASRPGVMALIAALDPTAEDAVAVSTGIAGPAPRRAVTTAAATAAAAAGGGSGAGPAAELAAMLCDALTADSCVRALAGSSGGGSSGASALVVVPAEQSAMYGPMGPSILTLLQMCAGSEPGRQAAVLALSSSRLALATLLRAVRLRTRAAKALAAAAAGMQGGAGDGHGGGRGGLLYDEDDEHDTSFQPESLYASALLLCVVRDTRLQSLAGWLPIAGAIADAARAEADLLGASSGSALLAAIGCDAEHTRRTSRELQGRAEAGMSLMAGGVAALVRQLDEGLPRLEAPVDAAQQQQQQQQQQQVRKRPPRDVDARAALALVRPGGEQRAAVATSALELLAVLLRGGSSTGRTTAAQLHGLGALAILERAVRTGTIAVRATANDASWAHAAGDALDAVERGRNRRTACFLLAAAVQALSALLLALRPLAIPQPALQPDGTSPDTPTGLHLRSRGVVDALLAAHAVMVLSYDSMAVALAGGGAAGTSGVPGAPSGSHELLPARLATAAALGAWIEAGWEPAVLPTAFGLAHSYRKEAAADKAHMGLAYILGAPGSAAGSEGGAECTAVMTLHDPAGTALAPERGFCLACLLGDLFPREWPPPPTPGQQHLPLPAPSNMSRRSALASALEPVSSQMLRLLSFGYNCESRLVRCAVVRMVAKAAGLGGGMPSFLAAPLVEALAGLVRGTGGAGGGGAGAVGAPAALTDARRLLEVMAPIAYKATIKAALLDARAVSCLSRFIHKLVSASLTPGAGAGGGGAGGAAEAVEVPVVTGQALEALRLLADPDVSLSPAAPREKRLQEDVPSVAESTAMVTALLSCLPFLGANANLAAVLLAGPGFGLSTYPAGRAALRQGAVKWHTAQAGIGAGGGSDLARVVEALRWAANRLRSSAESAKSSAAAGPGMQEGTVVAAACVEVAAKLEEVAAGSTESDIDADFPPPPSAPQRFVAAVAAATEIAAIAAAATAGAAPGTAAAVAAAAAAAADEAEGEDGSATAAWPWPSVCDNATQSFWRYCRARVVRGNVSRKLTRWDCSGKNASLSVASLLPPEPLSRRRRTRDVPRPAAAAAKPPPATGEAGSAGRAGAAAANPAAAPGGTDTDEIPIVTAPRRRGDMRARGSSSRAPSKHVDDYQRMAGGPPAVTAPATGGHASPIAASSPTAPRPPMGPPPPRPPPGPPPLGLGASQLPGPPSSMGASGMGSMGGAMGGFLGAGAMGGFRPPSLQPLPSAEADSLYDDLFAPAAGAGLGSGPGSGNVGPMGRSLSGSVSLQGRNSSSGGSGQQLGNAANGGGGGGGGPTPQRRGSLQQGPQSQQHRQQQQQAHRNQQQQHGDLGDALYAGLQPVQTPTQGGQQALPPPPPLPASMQQQVQQQQAQQQAGGTGATGGMTSQQLATLLRDPGKLRTLLATNPALAAIIAQNAASMGLNLQALQR